MTTKLVSSIVSERPLDSSVLFLVTEALFEGKFDCDCAFILPSRPSHGWLPGVLVYSSHLGAFLYRRRWLSAQMLVLVGLLRGSRFMLGRFGC